MDKNEAIKILGRSIELTYPLHSRGIASPDFEHWRNNTSAHIADIFGVTSIQLQQFTKISYVPSELIDIVAGSSLQGSQSYGRRDPVELAFADALNNARQIIRTMIGDLKNHVDAVADLNAHTALGTKEVSLMSNPTVTDTKNVFVVHGRNEEARKSLFAFLRAIGLHPLEWSQLIRKMGKGTPYIGEVLDAAFTEAQAVVVLITPDDEARLLESLSHPNEPEYELSLTPQARPNVIFEAGMAMGRNPDRTILVELGELRPFSDIAGRHVIRMNNFSTTRQSLAQRLQAAGCAVDLTGTDWHNAGDFNLSKPITQSRPALPASDEGQPHRSKPPPVSDVVVVNQLRGIGVQADFGVKLVKAGLMTNEELITALDTYVDTYFYDPRIHGLDPTRVDLEHTTANIDMITGTIG